ncbi:MAG: ABC transporter ATP-binding protein [Acidimicrobiia bacterium]|nr:ABC transporter ATP-binding protein [Acidimicrobiia bacterium]
MSGLDARFVAEPRITIDEVSKWFGQKVAVSEIACSIGPGVTGLLGPNGAGKTTLLRLITGLLRPSEGHVLIAGVDPRQDPKILGSVGFVAEDESVYGRLSARKFVEFNATLAGVEDPVVAAAGAIDIVDLAEAADRPVGEFSKGMRQRAKVAAALVHNPDILVLDEPLNGADPVQRAHLIELFVRLGSEGRTVLVSSHVLHEVERMASRIIAMTDGRLAAVGDVRSLRSLMTDIPQTIRIECPEPRRLAAALIESPYTSGVEIEGSTIHAQAADPAGLARALPIVARQLDIVVTLVEPEDESLESVFRYLIGGR